MLPPLWRGERIAKPLPSFNAKASRMHLIDDFPWNECSVPIVSDRVRRLLVAKARNQVQFLPVALSPRGQQSTKTYWLLNVLRVHDCYHRTTSKWSILSTSTGSWWDFSRFVIDSSRVPKSTMVFRDAKFSSPLFIRQSLRASIESSELTGAQFYSVEQTRSGRR